MIDHFGINVKDIEANKAFYEAVLAPLGYAKTIDEEPYGMGFSSPDRTQHTGMFWPSRAAVDAFYEAGLAAGGRDNIAPRIHADYHPNYYAAFLIDPNGHKIEAVCHKAP